MEVLFVNAADTDRHVSSANTAIYPNLGLLTLMSAVSKSERNETKATIGYLDGTVYGNHIIRTYIEENHQSISIICFSALTSNYGASVYLANIARTLNSRVIIIFGNDHFSALYERIMKNQPNINFGFYGSDIVEGFTNLVIDILAGSMKHFKSYSGLVFRDENGSIKRNNEDPNEYQRLPLVNYSLADSLLPHNIHYLNGQQKTYHFMRGRGLRSQVVDIGRGCIKFAGKRSFDIPVNACDFCGIIPGVKPIISQSATRAWSILENAYNQGYNYFYITADELPLTLWNMLKDMANTIPDWYRALPINDRPKMFGYARAEGFETQPEKINVIIDILGFDHFFIGFDGLSEVSLRIMNKGSNKEPSDLMGKNYKALQMISKKGCLITAGLVVTHIGITSKIMNENFNRLEEIILNHPNIFAALDFGPLCPIPGSQSFRYLTHPNIAKEKAEKYGLSVDVPYLESIKDKYLSQDCFGMDDLMNDFIRGCCPEINPEIVDIHLKKITDLAMQHSIVVGGGV